MKTKPLHIWFVFGFFLLTLLKLNTVYAQVYYGPGPAPPSSLTNALPPQVVHWSSTGENITIYNSSGKAINVTITVDKNPNSSGVDISNCGNIKHIDPGSSVICSTNDPNNPIILFSDSQTRTASGTYTIYQNC